MCSVHIKNCHSATVTVLTLEDGRQFVRSQKESFFSDWLGLRKLWTLLVSARLDHHNRLHVTVMVLHCCEMCHFGWNWAKCNLGQRDRRVFNLYSCAYF